MIKDIEIAVTYTANINQLKALHCVDRYTGYNVCESLYFLFQSEYNVMGRRGFKYDTKW